jgi:hypothetical protein
MHFQQMLKTNKLVNLLNDHNESEASRSRRSTAVWQNLQGMRPLLRFKEKRML